jgi:phospholipase C
VIAGDNGFDYSRLGVRVATVAISPWIAKGTLVHTPTGVQAPTPTSQFEASESAPLEPPEVAAPSHTSLTLVLVPPASIVATANRIFGFEGQFLTRRDAWAGTFDDLLLQVRRKARVFGTTCSCRCGGRLECLGRHALSDEQ